MGGLDKASSTALVLGEIEDILAVALAAALRQANDEAATAAQTSTVAALPARLAALDLALEKTGAANLSVIADVHANLVSGRVLEEATGPLREVLIVLQEPATHRLVLTIGASLPHFELVQPATERLSDTAWRAKLSTAAPERDAFARPYVSENQRVFGERGPSHPMTTLRKLTIVTRVVSAALPAALVALALAPASCNAPEARNSGASCRPTDHGQVRRRRRQRDRRR